MKIPKLNRKITFYIIVIILIIFFTCMGNAYGKKTFLFEPEKWQAVQLQNGDVYQGHLKTFPCCKLKDVYFLQTVQIESDTTSQLAELNSLFFGPENIMHFQKDQILWWADLSSNSAILEALQK